MSEILTVYDFEEYVKECREGFRKQLNYKDLWIGDLDDYIINKFSECTNQFEEDTLIENLKEEFEDYLKGLKEQA